ncbi:Holliday junction resolvase RuvX [Marinithermus hydrothermalis]|uniref:Putative pre-16S rRNA nuclease n=1 Tax=Marinithermus hydrothermalis (strain DSM 14884 / JCM 11576 / T1) TaxID=869210 RepID=F2NQ40_MARHT|nr:Holliday junction resolvase RuvX [Marinithermus hydrothermalis]AEB11351.1 Holliday junction resolvase [Marinithermus hydrothermalis DSM 14884]
MKVVALDVGDARIGLAAGDTETRFAFGRGYLQRTSLEADVQAVAAFAAREGAQRVVVGLPLRTDGSLSAQAEKVLRLVEALRRAGLVVETVDERYTTQLAQARVRALPKRKRREKGRLDEAAAVAILETYLGGPLALGCEP